MARGGDLAHIGRLKEEEEKALFETKDKLQQWQKFDEDYSALKARLTTLPEKVSHEVMVPFGKLAFMPGQLIHTNEILVLLGDNWFAERSATQACQIIDRRKSYVQKMMNDLKKQQYLLESRLGFVSEMKQTVEGKGDVVEIREEYDEQKERKWKEERRAKKKTSSSQKKSAAKLSSEKDVNGNHGNQEGKKEPSAEDLLWARLDELERQEEELDEMVMTDEEKDNEEEEDEEDKEEDEDSLYQSQQATPHHDTHKHVHWRDQEPSMTLDLGQENGDDEDDDEEVEEEDQKSMPVIRFSHTKIPKEDHLSEEEEKDESPRSPADIYELYHARSKDEDKRKTKSILKHSDIHQAVSIPGIKQEDQKRQPLPAPVSAFTGSIVEHSNPSQPVMLQPNTQGQGSKRVSKFKAARQGKR
nr:LOW QUALITY PROTEIN: unconventional prefoldin RPB5 interactor-like [Lytechinus pictus]